MYNVYFIAMGVHEPLRIVASYKYATVLLLFNQPEIANPDDHQCSSCNYDHDPT